MNTRICQSPSPITRHPLATLRTDIDSQLPYYGFEKMVYPDSPTPPTRAAQPSAPPTQGDQRGAGRSLSGPHTARGSYSPGTSLSEPLGGSARPSSAAIAARWTSSSGVSSRQPRQPARGRGGGGRCVSNSGSVGAPRRQTPHCP